MLSLQSNMVLICLVLFSLPAIGKLAQLHGNETPDYCAALSSKVIKVFTPQSLTSFDLLKKYNVYAFLLDKQKG